MQDAEETMPDAEPVRGRGSKERVDFEVVEVSAARTVEFNESGSTMIRY